MTARFRILATRPPLPIIAVILAAACGQAPPADSDAHPAQTAENPQSLPPDHPQIGAPAPGDLIAPPPKGSGTGAAGLGWKVPEGWIEEPPASAMRRAQYRVPGAAGDGECVVFYFGPGQGGDAMTNAVRWADQFSQPDGRPSREAMKTERIDVGGIPVLLAEVTGTYSGGMTMLGGPSQELADHMLLGAIAEGADANWFFKLTGPAATLRSQRQAFRSLIESLTSGS
jgi:hypothetical protein